MSGNVDQARNMQSSEGVVDIKRDAIKFETIGAESQGRFDTNTVWVGRPASERRGAARAIFRKS
jgi:hypothetical protein